LARQSQDFKIAGAFDRPQGLTARLTGVDVLIDFSSPEGTAKALVACARSKTRLVVGTTGLGTEMTDRIRALSKTTAVSLGANFLFELARLAAARLKTGYDIEIIEAHHRLKKDAPSGTARKIAEIIAAEKGWDWRKAARFGREGLVGERPIKEIGIHVIRAGDIVGEHTVLFSGPGETVELTHKAQSRDAFARGALSAALFLVKKSKGLYTMADVLG
jgi:4-hydroxy-tetrahydrodipicolinate reductase